MRRGCLRVPFISVNVFILLIVFMLFQAIHAEASNTQVHKLKGVVVDHLSRKGVSGAKIVLLVNGEAVKQVVIGEEGKFVFSIDDYDAGANYQLSTTSEGYQDELVDLSLTLKKGMLPERIEIALAARDISFNFRGNILNRETKKPIAGIRIMLINTRSGEVRMLESDHKGNYDFKVVSGYEYDIIFDHLNYLKRYGHINYCSDALEDNQKYCFSGFAKPALDPEGGVTSANVFVDKAEIGKKFSVNDIHYDYNDDTLREDALPNLRKLYHILKDNPQLVVELGSHTDSRGSDFFNFELSQRRADAAVAYVIDQGLAANRIAAKGYGEVALLNHCENGVKCSDEEHAKNRRTEFIIIDIDESAFVE